MGIQVVWQPEWPCPACGPDVSAFVAGWDDLFAAPPLRLAADFPGWTPEWGTQGIGEQQHLALNSRPAGQAVNSLPDQHTLTFESGAVSSCCILRVHVISQARQTCSLCRKSFCATWPSVHFTVVLVSCRG